MFLQKGTRPTVLKNALLKLKLKAMYPMPSDNNLLSDIQESISKDLFTTTIISNLKSGKLLVEEKERMKFCTLD